jgi:hypothetical protein
MRKLPYFDRKVTLVNLIESYFSKALTNVDSKSKPFEPPTLIGLALHLGFKSKEDIKRFDNPNTGTV